MTVALGAVELVIVFLTSFVQAGSANKTNLLYRSLLLLIALIGSVYFALYWNISFLIPITFVFLGSLMGIIYIQLDVILTNLFPISELRNIYPKMTVAYSLANITGGIILGSTVGFLGNHQSFLILIGTFIISLIILHYIFSSYKTLLTKQKQSIATQLKDVLITAPDMFKIKTEKTKLSIPEEFNKIRDSLRNLKSNVILRYIFLLGILSAVGYEFYSFALNTSITQQFNENDLTQFLAIFDIITSGFALTFRLFFLTKSVKYVSFSRAYLLHSSLLMIGTLVVAGLFIADIPSIYLFAAPCYIFIMVGGLIKGTSVNILYGLVPKQERDKARTFTDGVGESVSMLLSASLVAILVNVFPIHIVLPIAVVPIALYMYCGVRISHISYKALKKVFSLPSKGEHEEAIEILAERKGRKLLSELIAIYETSENPLKEKIIQTLGEIHAPYAYEFLHKQLFKAPPALKKSIIRSLGKYKKNLNYLIMYLIHQQVPSDVLRESIYSLIHDKKKMIHLISKELLHSNDPSIRKQAVLIMEEVKNTSHHESIKSFASDPAREVMQQALQYLYRLIPQERGFVTAKILALLQSANTEDVIVALKLIGKLSLKELQFHLLQNIDNQMDPKIKTVALTSLASIAPHIAIFYFSFYLTTNRPDSSFYAAVFPSLHEEIRKKIVEAISRFPVEAIDQVIKNLFPYRVTIHGELQELYSAIPNKFKAAS